MWLWAMCICDMGVSGIGDMCLHKEAIVQCTRIMCKYGAGCARAVYTVHVLCVHMDLCICWDRADCVASCACVCCVRQWVWEFSATTCHLHSLTAAEDLGNLMQLLIKKLWNLCSGKPIHKNLSFKTSIILWNLDLEKLWLRNFAFESLTRKH